MEIAGRAAYTGGAFRAARSIYRRPRPLQECTMLARYLMFAGYNAWCNERLYDAAALVAEPTIALTVAPSSNRCTALSTIFWSAIASGCGASPAKAKTLQASMQILYDDFAYLRVARQQRRSTHQPTTWELDARTTSSKRSATAPSSIRRISNKCRFRARSFFQSSNASPWAGACAAERHHRQRAHTEFRSDHLSARNRRRRAP